jgi:hypothetical protein
MARTKKQDEQTEVTQTETVPAAAPKRPVTEYEAVTMQDGRVVQFPGKTRLLKEIVFGTEEMEVGVQCDFRNGQSLTAWVPQQHLLYSAGHGFSQKLGDGVAGAKDEHGQPISDEDRFLAIEALYNQIFNGEWNQRSSGGEAVSGASFVIQAICEAKRLSLNVVKKWLDNKLKSNEKRWVEGGQKGPKPTRKALYATFRQPGSKTGAIIIRLEAEKAARNAPLESADAMLDDIGDDEISNETAGE